MFKNPYFQQTVNHSDKLSQISRKWTKNYLKTSSIFSFGHLLCINFWKMDGNNSSIFVKRNI